MAPTIPPGSTVEPDVAAYTNRAPQRWDVILFKSPPSSTPGHIGIMRVIGLPGEEVSFGAGGGDVYINGKPLTPPPILSTIRYQAHASGTGASPLSHPYTIPADSYYVLGDNTRGAIDSRYWGAVHRKDILGKVVGR